MKVIINGEEHNLEKETSVTDLVGKFSLKKESVAVELNLNIVKKDKYDATFVKEGDKIEIVHFVGGG